MQEKDKGKQNINDPSPDRLDSLPCSTVTSPTSHKVNPPPHILLT